MGVSWREYEETQERHLGVVAKYRRRGGEPSRQRTEEEERRALRTEFFKKKGKHPTPSQQAAGQMRMF